MIKNMISVFCTELRFIVKKIKYRKRFSYAGIQRFSPNTELSLENGAEIILGKKVRAHTGTKIRSRKNASITIGNDVAFNYNCMVTGYESISIGSGCEIGPGVMFFDHDHDYHNHDLNEGVYTTTPITVGKNVWIGANCVILRGAEIGDNSVIGAGTVVRKGKYPANSLIYQESTIIVKDINRKVK